MKPARCSSFARYDFVSSGKIRKLLGMEIVRDIRVARQYHSFSLILCSVDIIHGSSTLRNHIKKSHDAIIKQPIADRHNFVYIFS